MTSGIKIDIIILLVDYKLPLIEEQLLTYFNIKINWLKAYGPHLLFNNLKFNTLQSSALQFNYI